ncbi:unnamed protein product [Symbiodinium pilosum]|uniref:Apple domain-containing protein n=1 Tax=Symbiodinium pilosum TaxID=2952 RepID=A0A812XXE9_SYMPI|nr:unnamed protein product [Symbiodinium pilosum]
MVLHRLFARVTLLAWLGSAGSEALPTLRGSKGLNATSAEGAALRSLWQHAGCCNGCHTDFCSPQSGSCYDHKAKAYYLACGGTWEEAQPHANCCDSCYGSYCSPQSGSCYDSKGKDYYLECSGLRPNVGGWEQVAKYACTTSTQSQSIYDLTSRADCKERCDQTPWCRIFQFNTGTVDGCSSRSECMLLSNCDDVIYAKCWDYYHP